MKDVVNVITKPGAKPDDQKTAYKKINKAFQRLESIAINGSSKGGVALNGNVDQLRYDMEQQISGVVQTVTANSTAIGTLQTNKVDKTQTLQITGADGISINAETARQLTGNLSWAISLDYNATNLKMTSNELNTAQDIHELGTPKFAGLSIANGPKNMLIFYANPRSYKNLWDIGPAVDQVIARYDTVLYPEGASDPASTTFEPDFTWEIFRDEVTRMKDAGMEVWGYIHIGLNNPDFFYTVDEIKTRIDRWYDTGATHIFFDEFGYDYNRINDLPVIADFRQRQIDICSYVHSKGMNYVANTWEWAWMVLDTDAEVAAVQDIYGNQKYGQYSWVYALHQEGNPNQKVLPRTENDVVMFENLFVGDGGLKDEWVHERPQLFQRNNNDNVKMVFLNGLPTDMSTAPYTFDAVAGAPYASAEDMNDYLWALANLHMADYHAVQWSWWGSSGWSFDSAKTYLPADCHPGNASPEIAQQDSYDYTWRDLGKLQIKSRNNLGGAIWDSEYIGGHIVRGDIVNVVKYGQELDIPTVTTETLNVRSNKIVLDYKGTNQRTQSVATREDSPTATGVPFFDSSLKFNTAAGFTFDGTNLALPNQASGITHALRADRKIKIANDDKSVITWATNEYNLTSDRTFTPTIALHGDGQAGVLSTAAQSIYGNKTFVNNVYITSATSELGTATFTPGFAGEGFRFHQPFKDNTVPNLAWALDIDRLTVRQVMRIYELVIEKIRVGLGSRILGPGGGKVKSVVTSTVGSEVLEIDDPDDDGGLSIVPDDLVIVQKFNAERSTATKFLIRKVASITGMNVTLTTAPGHVPGQPPDVLTGQDADVFADGDDVVVFGNANPTAYPDRQSIIYESVTDSGAPFYRVMTDIDSVADWTSVANIKVQIGKMSSFTFKGQALSGYGAYFKDNIYISLGSGATAAYFGKGADGGTGNGLYFSDTNYWTSNGFKVTINGQDLSTKLTEVDASVLTMTQDMIDMWLQSDGAYSGIQFLAGQLTLKTDANGKVALVRLDSTGTESLITLKADYFDFQSSDIVIQGDPAQDGNTAAKIALGADAGSITVDGIEPGFIANGSGYWKSYIDSKNYVRVNASGVVLKAQSYEFDSTYLKISSSRSTYPNFKQTGTIGNQGFGPLEGQVPYELKGLAISGNTSYVKFQTKLHFPYTDSNYIIIDLMAYKTVWSTGIPTYPTSGLKFDYTYCYTSDSIITWTTQNDTNLRIDWSAVNTPFTDLILTLYIKVDPTTEYSQLGLKFTQYSTLDPEFQFAGMYGYRNVMEVNQTGVWTRITDRMYQRFGEDIILDKTLNPFTN